MVLPNREMSIHSHLDLEGRVKNKKKKKAMLEHEESDYIPTQSTKTEGVLMNAEGGISSSLQ